MAIANLSSFPDIVRARRLYYQPGAMRCQCECSPGYYLDGSWCKLCNAPCNNCTGGPDNCIDCLKPYYYYDDDGICVTDC